MCKCQLKVEVCKLQLRSNTRRIEEANVDTDNDDDDDENENENDDDDDDDDDDNKEEESNFSRLLSSVVKFTLFFSEDSLMFNAILLLVFWDFIFTASNWKGTTFFVVCVFSDVCES